MKTFGILPRWTALFALPAALGVFACSPDSGRSADEGSGSGGSSNGTGGSGAGNNDPTSTGTDPKVEGIRARCAASKIAPPALRRLTRGEFENTVRDGFTSALPANWASRLSPDQASKAGFTNNSTLLVVGQQTAQEILKSAEDVADAILDDAAINTNVPCAAAADEACAGTVVDTYGPRLFRRPITADERTRYVDLYKTVFAESNFKMGLKWMLVALLESPNTVYRSEIGDSKDGKRTLSQYELASEISYTYTGAPPDTELLGLAEQNKLGDATVRSGQAARLLDTPRGNQVVDNFFREWLEYGTIAGQTRADVPNFGAPGGIASNLMDETRLYIENAVFADKADFTKLMTGNFTILNKTLSDYYGYGGLTTNDWARVTRPADRGIGLLAQGAVLASTSHETATSPTHRGLLVFEKLLCNSRPKPPAGVPPISASQDQAKTTRERYELIHLKSAACASCHNSWEPAGFTFEQFDETGRYRANEDSYPIDPSGHLTLADKTEVQLANLDALSQQAGQIDQIQACFSGYLTNYMLGGGGGQECLAEEPRDKLAKGEIGIEEFLIEITGTPSFTTRQ